ncbi:MAG: hypothetical protein LIO94_10115 [Clostridiales bacterium]|nr:hypothetical protein [Clostridiales bacterium]
MKNKNFNSELYEGVKSGLVRVAYPDAVNNNYYIPVPFSDGERAKGRARLQFIVDEVSPDFNWPDMGTKKCREENTVHIELRNPASKKTGKAKKSILL